MSYKEYTVLVYDNGSRKWTRCGALDREDGPAYESSDGSTFWYRNDQPHRKDGPAVEEANGTKKWYVDGRLHREDGPAIVYPEGTKQWYLKGFQFTEAGFNEKMKPKEYTKEELERLLGHPFKIV